MENRILCRSMILLLSWQLCLVMDAFSQQIPKGRTAANGVFIGFYEYKPSDYSSQPDTKYPLIIFMHGIGERGNGTSNLSNLLSIGLPKYIHQGHPMRFYWNGKWETFLVLSPQLSGMYGNWENFYIDEMLKHAKNNLRVDTNRIFLTGLSLGGGGTWAYAGASLENAKQFAGIAPVCGTCQELNWCHFANAKLPIWAFHSQDDGMVGVGCTEGTISNINNCNPAVKPVKSIWPDGNHWIWDRAYDTTYTWQNPNLFEWFLAQNKSLPVNKLPVANAGADVTISTTTGTTTLNGASSNDVDGTIVKYIWRKISGPANCTISSPASSATAVSGLSTAGIYQFELTVVDNRAAIHKDIININVTAGPLPPPPAVNLPPVANAGNDISIMLPLNQTTLVGAASTDADGTITSYKWTKVSGPSSYNIVNSTGVNTLVTDLVQGRYEFKLQVTDNKGATANDIVVVLVTSADKPPVANAGTDITITLPLNQATLNGSASHDAEGAIINYQWSKIEGPANYSIGNVNAVKTIVSNLTEGTYLFTLRVWDSNWTPSDDTVMVKVLKAPAPPANQPPVAHAGNDIVIMLPTNAITLNGSTSSDPEGPIPVYEWTKIAGPDTYHLTNPSNASCGVNNLIQGHYLFRLQVTDKEGLSDDDTVQVIVNAAANRSPVANAGNDTTGYAPNAVIYLIGTASYDPDGTLQSFFWTRISGRGGMTILNSTSDRASVSGLQEGLHIFQLTIKDNKGATASDQVSVSIVKAPNKRPVANAGTDTTISLPSTSGMLNGTQSYDPDGALVKFTWKQLTGPATSRIEQDTSVITAIKYLQPGEYIYELTVTDNNASTHRDSIVVTVVNNFRYQEQLSSFPNPAINNITVKCFSDIVGDTRINLLNNQGTIVKRFVTHKSHALLELIIPVFQLQSGMYYIEVNLNGKKEMITRFVKL